jgi:hypothetical protein
MAKKSQGGKETLSSDINRSNNGQRSDTDDIGSDQEITKSNSSFVILFD